MLVGKTGTVIGWRMSDASLANLCKSLSSMWFSTELLGDVPALIHRMLVGHKNNRLLGS